MPAHILETKAVKEPSFDLTPEELEAVNAKILALKELYDREQVAKYKIELLFAKSRNVFGLTPGIVGLWESGSKLHGGGDAKLFICPGRLLGKNTCEAVIPDVGEGVGHLVCPSCLTAWNGPEVIGELMCKLPMEKWADLLLFYFVRLGHNADIVIKHAREDIRAASLAAAKKDSKHGSEDKLTINREKRVQYVYPLKNIIKDTSAGADLRKRFLAFLTA